MEPDLVYQIQAGPIWNWKVAVDLFLGGAGVGALLFAVALDVFFRGKYKRICQTAAWLSPILICLGLLFLLAKLGRPMHLPLTYLHFNPTSPLWWGSVFQPLLIVGGIWYATLWRKPDVKEASRRTFGWLLAGLAILVGAYHGLLMGVVTARPLWSAGPTVVSAMLGFVATGVAAVMVVHLVRMKIGGRLANEETAMRFFRAMSFARNIVMAALILQLGTFFLWWLSLKTGSLQDQQALVAAEEAFGPMFWSLGIGLGLILPLALMVFAAWKRGFGSVSKQVSLVTATSLMILVGGFFFRLAVLLGGQVPLPIPTLN